MAPAVSLVASEHPVKAATVFSSRKAEIVRTFAVDLDVGQNDLSITALPSCIDTESARVTGLGDAVLFDVVCTVEDHRGIDDGPTSSSDVLSALERHKGVLHGQKALRGQAADILVQFGHTLNAENNVISTVDTFLDTLMQRGQEILEEAKDLDVQIAELEKKIKQEKTRLWKERQKSPTHGRVSAVIIAKRAGRVDITLTYMVANATWSPSYDLRATTENGRPSRTVALHYRAAIEQNTGEDWRDAVISVSTATPGTWTTPLNLRSTRIVSGSSSKLENLFGGGKNAPSAGPFGQNATQQATQQRQQNVTSFGQPQQHSTPAFGQPQQSNTFASGTFGSSRAAPGGTSFGGPAARSVPVESSGGWSVVEAPGGEDAAKSQSQPELDGTESAENGAWTEAKTVVTESAVSSSFRIEGSCTIPSERSVHRVSVAILSFKAKVNYVAIPRTEPAAFLQCEVVNSSEYRLLPGPVNVYLDNSPVSKTSIRDVNPEEIFKCTLGPDPSLRIKYTRLPRSVTTSGSAFAAQTTSTTYKIITSVINTHSFPVHGLIVRDAAPIPPGSEEQNLNPHTTVPGIKVLLKQPKDLGEAAPDTLVEVASSGPSSSVKVRWMKDGNNEGKYEWLVDVGAGEEVKLEAEYEVRAPSDYHWYLREDLFHD
ncbi:hypothetical protein M0805_002353 [Coniferiporia weirii]|nr:hypothetical protein M0805_002353 [Coniferiporia weirii]